jgi:RNA 2',3'-cyclic 3'-phosphodiesterase
MRAFTAIEIPDDIKDNILKISETLRHSGVSLVKKEAIHITLHFFQEIDDAEASKIAEAMDTIHTGAFDVDLRGISYFGDREVRVVFAKVSDPSGNIARIFNGIGMELSKSGIEFDRKEAFTPHATIARVKTRIPELKSIIGSLSDYEMGNFMISRISLIKSVLSEEGPRYSLLHEHEI